MADVNVTPRIRCDNCGRTEDKVRRDKLPPHDWSKPSNWGGMKAEGSRSTSSYGGKERLDFTDLCPLCAQGALDAVHAFLEKTRSEGFDGPTGAE